MSDNLFYDSFFTIYYTLGKKISIIIFVYIYTIRFDFINKKFAKIFYPKLKIKPYCLIKLKLIKAFNGGTIKFFTNTIYFMLFVNKHIENLALLLIIKLAQHSIILYCSRIKNYKIILNMIYNSIIFISRYYTYLKAFV